MLPLSHAQLRVAPIPGEPVHEQVIRKAQLGDARLWFADGRWYLEDLQSANGTLVNNVRIYQPVALNDNDIVNFGDEVVIFNIVY